MERPEGLKMTAREWCKKHGIAEVHFAAVKMVTDKLTDEELATQVNIASAGWDPRKTNGYDKIQSLYQQRGNDQQPEMRSDDLEILIAIAGPRIEKALAEPRP